MRRTIVIMAVVVCFALTTLYFFSTPSPLSSKAEPIDGFAPPTTINLMVNPKQTEKITVLAMFPSGNRFVSGANDNRLKIWDLQSNRLVKVIDTGARISSLAVDTGEKFIFAGDDRRRINVWEIKTGKMAVTLGGKDFGWKGTNTGNNVQVTVDSQSKYVVGLISGRLYKWKFGSWEYVEEFKAEKDEWTDGEIYNFFEMDPHGKYVFAGGIAFAKGVSPNQAGYHVFPINMWDIHTGKLIARMRKNVGEKYRNGNFDDGQLVIDEKGKFLAGIGPSNLLQIWDIEKRRLTKSVELKVKPDCVLWGKNKDQLYAGWNYYDEQLRKRFSQINSIDVKKGIVVNEIFKLKSDDQPSSLLCGKDKRKLLFSHGQRITQLDIDNGNTFEFIPAKLTVGKEKHNRQLCGHNGQIKLSRIGHVAMVNALSKAVVVDLRNNEKLVTFQRFENVAHIDRPENVSDAVFDKVFNRWISKRPIPVAFSAISSSGDRAAVLYCDNTMSLWRSDSAVIQSQKLKGIELGKLIFGQSGDLIVYNRNVIQILDDQTFEKKNQLSEGCFYVDDWNGKQVGQLIMDEEKNIAFFTSTNGIRRWDLKSGKISTFLELKIQDNFFAYDPFNNYLLIAEGSKLKVLDATSGDMLHVIRAKGQIHAAAIDESNQRLVTATKNGGRSVLQNWDLNTDAYIDECPESLARISHLTVDEKLHRIVAGDSEEFCIGIWDQESRQRLATFYNYPGGDITITAEGYFEGSGDYRQYVHFVDDHMKAYDLSQFHRHFSRPDYVRDVLSGEILYGLESLKTVSAEPAPLVNITSPSPEAKTKKSAIQVDFSPRDTGGGIGDIFLYANGSLVSTITSEKQKDSKNRHHQLKVPLVPGKNKIEVIAFNKKNTIGSKPSEIIVTADYRLEKPDLHVLTVGIDRYKNSVLDLRYCVADAELFGKTLETFSAPLFKHTNFTSLTNPEETTKAAIVETFQRIVPTIKANDYFIFYNSSHGIVTIDENGEKSYSIVPHDVDLVDEDNLKRKCISMNEMIHLMGNIPAQNKILILDTCHAGAAGKAFQLAMAANTNVSTRGLTIKSAVELLKTAVGSSALTASQSMEEAIEGYKDHGLFTYTLIEGLKGEADSDGDKYISLSELKGYIEQTVYTRSKNVFNSTQVPYINVGSIDFPLTKKP